IFRSFQPAPPPEQELVILDASAWGDSARPYPRAGTPLRFTILATPPGTTRELAAGITATVTDERDGQGVLLEDQTLTVTFAKGSLELWEDPDNPDTLVDREVRLFGLDDGSLKIAPIDETIRTSDVQVSTTVKHGHPYLLAIDAQIGLDAWLEVAFNEALAGESGFEIYKVAPDGENLQPITPLLVEPAGTWETVRIRPQSGWLAGEKYRLRMTGLVEDVSGNGWLDALCSSPESCAQQSFEIGFEVAPSRVFAGFDLLAVRDLVRLGDLLFVAAGNQGLWILDANDPKQLTNYLLNFFSEPGGDEQLNFPFAVGDPVEGLAVDPHGRILVSGGGVVGPGQLKIFDPLALDPELLEGSSLDALRADILRGSTLLTQGPGEETVLPEGVPKRIEVLSDDVSEIWMVGDDPPAGVTLSPEELPAGAKPFTLTVTGDDGEAGHPVTLRNLSRGWWRRVDASEVEGEEGRYQFQVEVRRGEHLELLRNQKTLAYVVIEGHGVAAVDVNHFYGEFDDVDGNGVPDYADYNVQSQVLRYVSAFELSTDEPLCDPFGFWTTPLDLAILGGVSGTEEQPWYVPVLLRSQGVALLRADRNEPVDLELGTGQCGVSTLGGVGAMGGMAVVEGYPMWVIYDDPDQEDIPVDEDGEPLAEGPAERDYLVMTNTYGWVLIVDVTKREDPRVVSMIRLPEEEDGITSAANVAID
ncbi:MAG: hypothetical protein GY856_35235, partial [bacterium]|nr:hypothetical protein [bacterium]